MGSTAPVEGGSQRLRVVRHLDERPQRTRREEGVAGAPEHAERHVPIAEVADERGLAYARLAAD